MVNQSVDEPKFPVIATAGNAVHFCMSHTRAFFIAGAVPLVLSHAIWFSSFALLSQPWNRIISDSLFVFPATLFTVSWCRLVLFGSNRAFPAFIEGWSKDHQRVLGIHLVLTVIYLLTIYGVDYIVENEDGDESLWGPFAQLTLAIVVYAYVLRFSLAFCGAVTDRRFGLWRAWQCSKGHTLRLLFAVILASFLVLIPAIAFDYSFEVWTGLSSEWPDAYRPPEIDLRLMILSFGDSFFELAFSALQLAIVCSLFRRLTGWQPPADPSLLNRFD